jgi:hypothetical protein
VLWCAVNECSCDQCLNQHATGEQLMAWKLVLQFVVEEAKSAALSSAL